MDTGSKKHQAITADEIFASADAPKVPSIADRYTYKKDPGDSDAPRQLDAIRT